MPIMAQQYFQVVVAGARGNSVLTYHSQQLLEVGRIVKIPLKDTSAFGIVTNSTTSPGFTTREITAALELPLLPDYVLTTIDWLAGYYGCDPGEAAQLFLPKRPDLATHIPAAPATTPSRVPELNSAQTSIIEQITTTSPSQWLLHGVTGSGKTAVYIELVRRMFASGKSAIVLVPEITLATQVIGEFERYLDSRVIIVHSQLTAARRRQAWQRALNASEPVVVIGPRSALFLPLQDLGAIIIDECHEHSYKQEQTPHYHARTAAQYMARGAGAQLVLASATPSVHDMHQYRQGHLQLLSLPEPIHANPRQVDIIDLRHHKSVISPSLQQALESRLQAGEQSILFINRRGSASQVLCSHCGWVARCPGCDIPQTWHGDSGRLRCHWCGSHARLPGSCPDCRSLGWRFLGIGTKRIEADIVGMFPQARTMRLDKDSASPQTIDNTLKSLQNGEIDILIGTQMIAKGLDLPGVTLIGVVLADTMLHIPDISSNERTYQLLHQVIGRAGRRLDQPSQVVIQTYHPEHPAITQAARQDFDTFMEQELKERAQLHYPPYCHLLKLTCKRKTQVGASRAAHRLAEKLRHEYPDAVTVRGPAPAWRERMYGHYYWHLIVTAQEREPLLRVMRRLPQGWQTDIDPIDLL